MFLRIRNAFGLSLLLSLVTSVAVFAKGGFSFITVSGPQLKEAVRVTDPGLTTDFFAFANFYEDRIKEPSNPGEAYEIMRFYIDDKREIAFDRLLYYPETGFVFYDGIINGESEYDDKWYTANSKIKPLFEAALAAEIQSIMSAEKNQPVLSASQPGNTDTQFQPAGTFTQYLPIPLIALTIALAVLIFLWRRRLSTS